MELFASLRHSRVNLPCSFFSILFKICSFDNFKVSFPLVAGLGKSSYQWCISPGTYDSVHLVQWRPRLTPMLGCLAGSFLITCVSTNLISPSVESFKVSPSRRKYTLWLSKAVWLHVLIIHFTCIGFIAPENIIFFSHVSNTFGQRTYKRKTSRLLKLNCHFQFLIIAHIIWKLYILKIITLIYSISFFIGHDLEIRPDSV